MTNRPAWKDLTADYSNTTRHRMPRMGDLVRLAGAEHGWQWHAIVDDVWTDNDTASPDGVTVTLVLRPARILSPLYAAWQGVWHREGDTVPMGEDRIIAAEHAVEWCVVNQCRPGGVGWTRYATDAPFPFIRA